MLYKYQVLKSSWGIVVFLDMDEIPAPGISGADVKIADRIYLRISDSGKLRKEIIVKWMGEGINALAKEIYSKIDNTVVCFDVKKLDFNYTDFQEEGLYCAVQGWLARYYKFEIEPVEVTCDTSSNKYIFSFPATNL